MGWEMLEIPLLDLKAAIQEARGVYNKTFVKEKDKQVTIFTKEGMVWKYYNGKTQTFTP